MIAKICAFFLVLTTLLPLSLAAQDQEWFRKGLETADPKEQVDLFTHSIEQGEDPAAAYFCRASALLKLGRIDSAIADYTRCIELDSSDAGAWFNRGNARKMNHDIQGAIADFARADRIDSAEGDKVCIMCDLYSIREDWANAIECYRICLELTSAKAAVFNNLGWCCLEMKNDSAAIRYFNQCLRLQPDFVYAWLNLALLYYREHDLENARKDLENARQLRPALNEGAEGFDKIKSGGCYYSGNCTQEMKKMLSELK